MLLLSFALLLLAIVSDAHVPYYEPERLRHSNFDCTSWACWKPSEDFSFKAPFDIIAALNSQLFPGERRNPTASLFVSSRLNGVHDVDYFLFNKTDNNETSLVGYTLVDACDHYKHVFLPTALMGPSDTVDKDGKLVFSPPTGEEPFQVPKGYGILITKPLTIGKRPRYCARETGNCWYLPIGYDEHCIDNYSDPACAANPSVITVQGVKQPGKYIFAVYRPRINLQTPGCPYWRHRWGCRSRPGWHSRFTDYAFVTGTKDQFLPSDFARLGYISKFISSGRLVSRRCEAPF